MKNKIKEFRLIKGLSQEKLAQELNTTKQTISRLEKGKIPLTQSWMEKIAAVLGKKPFEIIYDDAYRQGGTAVTGGLGDTGFKTVVAKIPVFGIVDASDDELYSINTEDTPLEWIEPVSGQAGDKAAFALRVAGHSMSPKFEPDLYLYITTRRPVLKGDECVVEFTNGTGWIKTFVSKTQKTMKFSQFNPSKEIDIPADKIKRLLLIVGTQKK